jgi:predicted GNAT superfamily acetyltransferase
MLRDARAQDHPAVVSLNEDSVRFLSPMDAPRLSRLAKAACYFRVAEVEKTVVAFLLAFRKGAEYDSPNFQWFNQRFDDFIYLDRVVVGPKFRGKGIAKNFYTDLERFAVSAGVFRLTCEVDVSPPNPISLKFHDAWGFREIDRHAPYDGSKIVSLRTKLLRLL